MPVVDYAGIMQRTADLVPKITAGKIYNETQLLKFQQEQAELKQRKDDERYEREMEMKETRLQMDQQKAQMNMENMRQQMALRDMNASIKMLKAGFSVNSIQKFFNNTTTGRKSPLNLEEVKLKRGGGRSRAIRATDSNGSTTFLHTDKDPKAEPVIATQDEVEGYVKNIRSLIMDARTVSGRKDDKASLQGMVKRNQKIVRALSAAGYDTEADALMDATMGKYKPGALKPEEETKKADKTTERINKIREQEINEEVKAAEADMKSAENLYGKAAGTFGANPESVAPLKSQYEEARKRVQEARERRRQFREEQRRMLLQEKEPELDKGTPMDVPLDQSMDVV